MIDALSALDGIQTPGAIRRLPYQWADDDSWKERVMRPRGAAKGEPPSGDDRLARFDTPQYQYDSDRQAAERNRTADGCPTCVFLTER